MVKLERDKHPPVLRVSTKPGQTSNVFEETDNCSTDLLGYILAQAYSDGMSALRIRAELGTQSVELKYFGLSPYGAPTWWQMSPPPCGAYSGLIKAVVGACMFESGMQPVGVLRLVVNGYSVDVKVELRSWYDVEMHWAPRPPPAG